MSSSHWFESIDEEIDATADKAIRLECAKIAASQSRTPFISDVIAKAKELERWVNGESDEYVTYDDNTMLKVYTALEEDGLTREQATTAVSAMQNAGILFRERRK